MDVNSHDIERIKKEDWRKAPGIMASIHTTNSALAERNYDLDCRPEYKICVIEGYWIWWCSVHHQPIPWCEKGKLLDENIIIRIKKT